MTLPEMLAATVRRQGSRIAIVDQGVAIRYAALEQRVRDLAATLYAQAVRPGHRVALLLPNGAEFVTSYFAVLTLGATVVPLNEHYQETELLRFFLECRVSCVITSPALAPLCRSVVQQRALPCAVVLTSQAPPASPALELPVGPGGPAMYQFSSGSTGAPKRIARTHANLLFELDSLARTLNFSSTDRFLGVAPFSHVNGLMRSMLASIHTGATLYPVVKFERQAVAALIANERISVFIAVPFMFAMLAKAHFHRRPDFSSLRLCVSASAPLPKAINLNFHDRFGMYVRQLYGSTETGTISVNALEDIAQTLESVGRPLEGVQVEVRTDDGRIAEPGQVGELAVRSTAAVQAYDGPTDVNREAFRDGYFLTGDLGRKDSEGLIYLLGRKKFFINKGGYKIDPHEIEAVLESHPKVEEAVAIGMPTVYGDERIRAVVVLRSPCDEDEIFAYCRGKIAAFKIPSVIEFRDSLPKSATGKVLRDALREERPAG
jgi:long-chain acyl-CoA synthetase